MKITDARPGQVVKFIAHVERSSKGQDIQEVLMRVAEVTATHIRGMNVNRLLDGTQDTPPYRTFKISNIVRQPTMQFADAAAHSLVPLTVFLPILLPRNAKRPG